MKKAKTNLETFAAKTKKSELRREAILNSALALFDSKGFASTSLDDIARETGIKREAIYYYFKNRAEILLCLIQPQIEELVGGLKEIVESDVDATTKLHGAIRNHVERFDRHCLEMTIGLRDVYLEEAKEVRGQMDKIWRQYEKMWTRIIEEGQESRQFVRCGRPKMIAFGILGTCNWLARWYDPKKSVSVNELIETYFHMIALGLVRSDRRKTVGAYATAKSAPPKASAGRTRSVKPKISRART